MKMEAIIFFNMAKSRTMLRKLLMHASVSPFKKKKKKDSHFIDTVKRILKIAQLTWKIEINSVLQYSVMD